MKHADCLSMLSIRQKILSDSRQTPKFVMFCCCGLTENASAEKNRLEEKQRKVRKDRAKAKDEWKPRYRGLNMLCSFSYACKRVWCSIEERAYRYLTYQWRGCSYVASLACFELMTLFQFNVKVCFKSVQLIQCSSA